MDQIGIHTGADLRKFSLLQLTEYFGKSGHIFYNFARAIDTRLVVPDRTRKSVGTENTFGQDITDTILLLKELRDIQTDLYGRIRRRAFYGRTLTLKIKFDDFQQITRSRTVPFLLDSLPAIAQLSEQIFYDLSLQNRAVRLMGLNISNTLQEHEQTIQLRIPSQD